MLLTCSDQLHTPMASGSIAMVPSSCPGCSDGDCRLAPRSKARCRTLRRPLSGLPTTGCRHGQPRLVAEKRVATPGFACLGEKIAISDFVSASDVQVAWYPFSNQHGGFRTRTNEQPDSSSIFAQGARSGVKTARIATRRLPPPITNESATSPIPPRTPAGGTPNLRRVCASVG